MLPSLLLILTLFSSVFRLLLDSIDRLSYLWHHATLLVSTVNIVGRCLLDSSNNLINYLLDLLVAVAMHDDSSLGMD